MLILDNQEPCKKCWGSGVLVKKRLKIVKRRLLRVKVCQKCPKCEGKGWLTIPGNIFGL